MISRKLETVRRIGPLVELHGAARPTVFERLSTGDPEEQWQVVHRGRDGVVLGAAIDAAGASSSGSKGPFVLEGVGEGTIRAICDWSEQTSGLAAGGTLIETGIKAVDLLCPLIDGGMSAFFGGPGQGRVVLLQEIHHRLAGTAAAQRFLFLIAPEVAQGIPDMIAADPDFPPDEDGELRTWWAVTDRAGDPEILAPHRPWTTRFVFSAEEARRENYPALDLLASDTAGFADTGMASARHVAVADQARRALGRLAEASGDGSDPELDRARLLRIYLTQPFFVTARSPKTAGVHVPLAETIGDCEAILSGACDGVPAESLHLKGSLRDAGLALPSGS